jgi:hypothetical protein
VPLDEAKNDAKIARICELVRLDEATVNKWLNRP